MMRWVLFSLLIVGVAAGGTIALQYLPEDAASPVPAKRATESKGPPPSIVLAEEPIFAFGTMPEQTEQTKTWTIRNEGPGELVLNLEEKSCTCTNVSFGDDATKLDIGAKLVIPAGEERELCYSWNTRNKLGEFSSNVRFSTNDFEKRPTLIFAVEGEVLPSVVVVPPQIDLGEVSSEQPSKYVVLVYSPSKPDFKIPETPTTSRGEFFSAEVKELSEEELKALKDSGTQVDRGYQIVLEVKPGLPLGRLRDALVIKTDHPSRPRIDVELEGKVVGPISAMPSTILMAGISGKNGGAQQARLNVRGQAETHFEVVLPPVLQDAIRVQIEPEGPASEGPVPVRKYRMTVEVVPGTKAGQLSGTIVLKTDHPNASEVKIPLQAFIQAG